MGGEIREYLKAYWAAARKAYGHAKAVWNVVAIIIPALGWLGVAQVFPLPVWAAGAWVVLYIVTSLLIYLPVQMWQQQRAEIAQLILPHGPIPDMPISELFKLVGHNDPEKSMSEVGMATLDKLSTGQLLGWGRTQERRLFAPLVPIEQSYWGSAGWSYYFLADKRDSMADDIHVWPRLTSDLGGQRFYDVHVNRAQAARIWGTLKN